MTDILYSEKQIKGIKIILTLFDLKEYFQIKFFYRTTNLQFSKMQNANMIFMGHWLLYTTIPNVTTLFTRSSQAIKLVFIYFAANLI